MSSCLRCGPAAPFGLDDGQTMIRPTTVISLFIHVNIAAVGIHTTQRVIAMKLSRKNEVSISSVGHCICSTDTLCCVQYIGCLNGSFLSRLDSGLRD